MKRASGWVPVLLFGCTIAACSEPSAPTRSDGDLEVIVPGFSDVPMPVATVGIAPARVRLDEIPPELSNPAIIRDYWTDTGFSGNTAYSQSFMSFWAT